MSDTCTLGKQLCYAAQNAAGVKQRVALSSLSAKKNDTNNQKRTKQISIVRIVCVSGPKVCQTNGVIISWGFTFT